jgi:hypothetical protein
VKKNDFFFQFNTSGCNFYKLICLMMKSEWFSPLFFCARFIFFIYNFEMLSSAVVEWWKTHSLFSTKYRNKRLNKRKAHCSFKFNSRALTKAIVNDCTHYFQRRKNTMGRQMEKYSTFLGMIKLNVVCWRHILVKFP